MKNILGTEVNLDLFNQEGVRVYAYRKGSDGLFQELTFDSNQNILTFKNSDGFSYEATYDSDNKELTYKNSDGLTRGFDKTYTPEEIEFMNRAVEYYWQDWNAEHPDNQNDFKLTQQILSK
jgi:hypothetical protein